MPQFGPFRRGKIRNIRQTYRSLKWRFKLQIIHIWQCTKPVYQFELVKHSYMMTCFKAGTFAKGSGWIKTLCWCWFSTLRYLIRGAWYSLRSLLFIGTFQSSYSALFLFFQRFYWCSSHYQGLYEKIAFCFETLNVCNSNSHRLVNLISLTYLKPMFHFYTPRKRQKSGGILTCSGGRCKVDYWFTSVSRSSFLANILVIFNAFQSL